MATTDVTSPVTGSVWKLECKEGQQVSEDDVLMILESMKMEIPVTAAASGTVEGLTIAEGTAVDEDAVLCVIRS
ncbi:acetyl-CoA carboxylase biotin carboxyl carrier protein subunit [Nitratireductor indicus]|uniref:Allophanate hydrolase n=1 Tax=Nitratireductor indicus C115 TaxID=1231190 RepID=K2NV84_9HYPH|nr:acetyl-CoA carboxylase biotin carboxyl carrier protein subunit [Nitratireductor indicus]EKF43235.1 allophanate hydrolase [Nitratireductor indicus C115]MDS1137788.1 acetyl-CoA carboxylase biotin carboxyl carrier protein subunit [Nitratireductor indicus]SFQ53938.1 acetyl-CoA carboxylase biotin carboxyl carrier protein [Nitratireductor indicus]